MEFLNENTTLIIVLLLIVILGSIYLHNKGMMNWAKKPMFLFPLGILGSVAAIFTIFTIFVK